MDDWRPRGLDAHADRQLKFWQAELAELAPHRPAPPFLPHAHRTHLPVALADPSVFEQQSPSLIGVGTTPDLSHLVIKSDEE